MITNENFSHNAKNQYDQQQNQFDNWCDKWDAAKEAGIFDDAPKSLVPTMDLSQHSFFGPIDSNPSDNIQDVDAEYWGQVHDMAAGRGPDPMEVITEGIKRPATEIVAERPRLRPASGWSKKESTASSKVSKSVGTAANPIYPNTVGKDQALIPSSLDATFSERDIEELAEMKVKLYRIENKVNAAEGNSKSGNQYKTQIEGLRTQIDELSDLMTRTHPGQAAP